MLFTVIAHGRNGFALFNPVISLKGLTTGDKTPESVFMEFTDQLSEQFKHQRRTLLGEKLYDRNQIVEQIANSRAIDLIIESL